MYYSRPNEILQEHVDRVINNYNKLKSDFTYRLDELDIDNKIINILFDNVIKYHDFGKMNPYFQKYIIGDKTISKEQREHSKLSTIKYLNDMYSIYIKPLNGGRKTIKQKKIFCKIIINLSFNIMKHHGNLLDKENDNLYLHKLIEHYNNNKAKYINLDIDINNIIEIKKYNTSDVTLGNKLIVGFMFKYNYCLLIESDYLAVYEHNKHKILPTSMLDEKLNSKLINRFKNDDIISGIYKHKKGELNLSEINSYRSDMFIESEENLMNSFDSSIFFLEAPTGSGKSNVGMNLAFDLVDESHKRIVYVSPLNNIAEQMYNTTKDKIKSSEEEMVMINSRQYIINNDEYDTDYLNYQTFNYPIVITSHVKLFNIIFGTNKNDLLGFNALRNSIIVLDEIQNYNNKNWIKQINLFCVLCKIFNIKFIIMSATLPKMTELIFEENKIETVDLIRNTDKYYNFFKNRVRYDYGLLDKLNKKEKNDIDDVFNKIDEVINNTKKHRILIETLTIKSCEEFYTYLHNKYPRFKVFKMLSTTNSVARKHIINMIQQKNNKGEYKYKDIILVGTQCIEAGIDIDMNIGFKDISMLDCDEQFIGRLERNFKDVGVCYFFDIDNDEYIYKDDYRIENNLKHSKEYRNIFENKSFQDYYKNNYNWLLKKEIDNYNDFCNDVHDLKYTKIKDGMRLIDNETFNFLFLCKYANMGSEDILKELIKNESENDFCKKQIIKKKLLSSLNKFTASINSFNFKEDPSYEKCLGYYIVPNGNKYFSNIENGELTVGSDLNLNKFVLDSELFI